MRTTRYAWLLVWLAAVAAGAAVPSPDGQWRGFAARDEIRPRFEALPDGRFRADVNRRNTTEIDCLNTILVPACQQAYPRGDT